MHVPPCSSARKMFVDNNIPNFEVLFRKEVFSFASRLNVKKVCYLETMAY